MLRDGEPPFSPETPPETGKSSDSDVPQEITGRGRERFSVWKQGLAIGLLVGAGMFGVLTGSSIIVDGLDKLTTRLGGFFELSAAVGVVGGAVWIIEPFLGRLPHKLVEYLGQR